MSTQFKSADEVLKILRQAGVEIASYNRDEGVLSLTIPVDDPVEDIELNDFERGFITAFCLEINVSVRADHAASLSRLGRVDAGELPCDDWSDRCCRVPSHNGEDEKRFDINYGFIEDRGSYRFWATAYPVVDFGEVTKTDGNRYVRIV